MMTDINTLTKINVGDSVPLLNSNQRLTLMGLYRPDTAKVKFSGSKQESIISSHSLQKLVDWDKLLEERGEITAKTEKDEKMDNLMNDLDESPMETDARVLSDIDSNSTMFDFYDLILIKTLKRTFEYSADNSLNPNSLMEDIQYDVNLMGAINVVLNHFMSDSEQETWRQEKAEILKKVVSRHNL